MGFIKQIQRVFDKVEEIVLVISVCIMIIMNFANVICRFLLPQTPFSYTEEFTILLFVWCTMLGISYAFKRHAHTGLTIITDRLQPKIRKYFVLFTTVLCVVMLVILVKAGFSASINQITHGQIMSGLKISAAWQSMAIPVGGILVIIRCLDVGITDFLALARESKGVE